MDILTIGNAIVDSLALVEDNFIYDNNLPKGAMRLVTAEEIGKLYQAIPSNIEKCSGGSAANTAAGIATLGGNVGFVGKVADDELGRFFEKDLAKSGVIFDNLPQSGTLPTASCLVLITEDGERTMNTYLGACTRLHEEDINEDLVASADITYIEGYLWDSAQDAIHKVIDIAHKNKKKIAFTLSDSFCVERHRNDFLELLPKIDILFGNKEEIQFLYQTTSLEDALKELSVPISCITNGNNGSIIIDNGKRYDIAPIEIKKLVDTTGAGDLYAAGFLYGYSQGKGMEECGALGSECAVKVIQQVGARI